MTPRFELTAPAERDLEDIFFEVKERHGLLVAERVYSNLLRTFDLLANMPETARHHGDRRRRIQGALALNRSASDFFTVPRVAV